MKIKIRRSCNDDIDKIFDLHSLCFSKNDCWYKSAIANYVNNGIVIQVIDTNNIIGVLLQGNILPCSNFDKTSEFFSNETFESVNDYGSVFFDDNLHKKEHMGIVMICIHPDFRGKGLAKKLIEKHFQDNKGKLVCLNTRKSNHNAISLYKSMGYIHIGNIPNKYFLPNEDSVFMIKILE